MINICLSQCRKLLKMVVPISCKKEQNFNFVSFLTHLAITSFDEHFVIPENNYPYHTTGGILEFQGRGGFLAWTGIRKEWRGVVKQFRTEQNRTDMFIWSPIYKDSTSTISK